MCECYTILKKYTQINLGDLSEGCSSGDSESDDQPGEPMFLVLKTSRNPDTTADKNGDVVDKIHCPQSKSSCVGKDVNKLMDDHTQSESAMMVAIGHIKIHCLWIILLPPMVIHTPQAAFNLPIKLQVLGIDQQIITLSMMLQFDHNLMCYNCVGMPSCIVLDNITLPTL